MNLWVYVGDGIGVYFVVFSSGESVPVEGSEKECRDWKIRVI